MNVHTCPNSEEYATRFHDLYDRTGKIRRQLSAALRQMRCNPAAIDFDALAELRAEADVLAGEVGAFLNENNLNN